MSRNITITVTDTQAEILAALGINIPAKASKPAKKATARKTTTKATKPVTAKVTEPGVFKRISRDAFRAMKAAGKVPAGMTQQQAHDLGLLDGTKKAKTGYAGQPKVTARKTKATAPKGQRKNAPLKDKHKASATSASFGKSLAAIARTSGLWAKTDAGVVSLYTVAVHDRWNELLEIHHDGYDAKSCFEALLDMLAKEGVKVGSAKDVKWARKAREAKQAARDAYRANR